MDLFHLDGCLHKLHEYLATVLWLICLRQTVRYMVTSKNSLSRLKGLKSLSKLLHAFGFKPKVLAAEDFRSLFHFHSFLMWRAGGILPGLYLPSFTFNARDITNSCLHIIAPLVAQPAHHIEGRLHTG